jgi:hypothetical protein
MGPHIYPIVHLHYLTQRQKLGIFHFRCFAGLFDYISSITTIEYFTLFELISNALSVFSIL